MTMILENNMWNSLCEFEKMLRDEDCDSVDLLKNNGMTVVALYSFYHYFNADNTKIEEMLNGIVIKNHPNLHVVGVFPSSLDEESVDFLSMMEEDYFKGVFLSDVEGRLKELATKMAYIVVKTPYMDNEDIISVYTGLNNSLSEDNVYTNRILCGFQLPVEEKIRIQKHVSEYTVNPLIIDQPEDDLDNSLIYNLIVKSIRQMKKKRQIIIVTHNPNIPVLGDAEGIIILERNKNGRVDFRMNKKAGCIEEKVIRNGICEIMEGGEDAFRKREEKYLHSSKRD